MAKRIVFLSVASFLLSLFAGPGHAQTIGPDVIVSNIPGIEKDGTVGTITAYAIGTTSCNLGDATAIWLSGNNQHPVIAQNMYRLENGRIEQIGMSWLKHGFCAVNEFSCGACQSTDCSNLGIHCADTYGSGLNASQGNLGPRSDVNAATGSFTYPFPTQGQSGNAIYKRLQVHNDDLNPSMHPGAMYFVEGHYICPDEPAWGTQFNNASYRRIIVGGLSGGGYNLSLSGSTEQQAPAIMAWQDFDTGVTLENVMIPNDGLMILGYKVTDLGNGSFHYEYALYNMNSDRSAGSFSIPIPGGVTITNVGFHDVDYHSGEPYSGTDWTSTVAPPSLTWSTDSYTTDPNANALRWATTYNFRFDANSPPQAADATIGLFKPGTPTEMTVSVMGPSGDFTTPVSNVSCDYVLGSGVELAWTNGDTYDSIDISRDGASIATLAGSATTYTDNFSTPGPHTYAVTAYIGGIGSGGVVCTVDIPVPPPLVFQYDAPDQTVNYDPATGIGSFTEGVDLEEDAGNVNYPNDVLGLSLSLAHDGTYLESVDITPGSALTAMNGGSGPDFFAPAMYPNGSTLGIVFSYMGNEVLHADTPQEFAVIQYNTVPGTLAGNMSGATTELTWQDGIGDVPVYNSVVVGVDALTPFYLNASIDLQPGASAPLFIRGDANGDGDLNIADPIANLTYQFQGGPANCIDALDVNDDGSVDIADPITNLTYQFQSGPPPAAPFPTCGADTTPDAGGDLGCLGPVPACP